MIASKTRPLTTAEFEASVAAANPRIAVFDCDGTLWSGDAGSSFMRWTIETGLLRSEAALWLGTRYDAYRRGEVDELQICGEMVQVYQGLREADLRAAAAIFFAEYIEPNIFPEMQRVVATLQRSGAEIWAVSSTCDWVIEEGMHRFNIAPDRVLAASVAVQNGLATSQLRDVPTDAGKVVSLVRVGVHKPDAVFGNSIHDAAMLGIARQPFAVNPTPALVLRSGEAGWPIYLPASVRAVEP